MQALKNISANDDTAHKRERRKEARPQELIEAALTLFVDKGYAATKVDEVAALAGVVTVVLVQVGVMLGLVAVLWAVAVLRRGDGPSS